MKREITVTTKKEVKVTYILNINNVTIYADDITSHDVNGSTWFDFHNKGHYVGYALDVKFKYRSTVSTDNGTRIVMSYTVYSK